VRGYGGALSLATFEASPVVRAATTGQFIAKGEMAMRRRGVSEEEVGVKCGCMQVCFEGAGPGVRSWQAMVAMGTKTNKVGAAARQA